MKTLALIAALGIACLAAGCRGAASPGDRKLSAIESHYQRAHADLDARFEKAQAHMCDEQILLQDIHADAAAMTRWAHKNEKVLWAFQHERERLDAAEKTEKARIVQAIIDNKPL